MTTRARHRPDGQEDAAETCICLTFTFMRPSCTHDENEQPLAHLVVSSVDRTTPLSAALVVCATADMLPLLLQATLP